MYPLPVCLKIILTSLLLAQLKQWMDGQVSAQLFCTHLSLHSFVWAVQAVGWSLNCLLYEEYIWDAGNFKS